MTHFYARTVVAPMPRAAAATISAIVVRCTA